MKKLGAILLIVSLIFSLFPQQAKALEATTFEQDLTEYLNEISMTRGFEVTKGDIEESLSYFSAHINDYDNVQELKEDLGEVIKSDLSNLSDIYERFDMNVDELTALLDKNGEELKDYIFLNNLDSALYFYQSNKEFEREPDFDQKFADYISLVSSIRGFQVTKEDIYDSLAKYESTIDEYETVEDLSDFLGEVIKADLSNLNYFYKEYDLDKESIFQLLDESGEDINDYIFIEDLETKILDSYYGEFPGIDEDMIAELLPIILEELGITDKEMQQIIDYFTSMEDYLSSPEVEQRLMDLSERLMDLGERLMNLGDTAISDGLTDELVSEITSLYNEFLSILKINIVYTIEKNGVDKPISFEQLLKLESLADNEKLKVAIYGSDSKLLADFIITNDMFDSIMDKINGIEEEIIDTVNQHKPEKSVKNKSKTTVNGAKLPKTASNYIPNSLFGLFIAFIGILLFKKVRNIESEIIQK
ncbi:processed acidic surface protein [Mobilisporobacter senegalensis]|uniref:Processed acidic surface protein n=1 Tax=Mobilisporobacter senegalensis TaxID=1329262 RepID=A0A3N1XAU1_9FIRM|nr:processed acidic surface protein [Mobilisporobacter senegalensis]ROR23876.1 processed acidic surface protein [Mobilisporobacter senegalensis]